MDKSMNKDDLMEIVGRGEDSRHQFKVDVTNTDSLAAEVVAFLNANGGTLFIGVDDKGEMVGLDGDGVRRVNQMISSVGSQHIKNPVSLTTENVSVGINRIVIVLQVEEGKDKPYFDRNGVIWLKEAADKRRVVSKEEIRRLFESSASLHADEQSTKAKIEHLDLLRFRQFFEKSYGVPMPEEKDELRRVVTNMNLATDDGCLNLAGLMMFGRHPEFFVPQFCVKAVRINGNDMSFTSFLDREDFAGTIPDMYAGAMAFVMRNMHKTQRAESVNMPGESEIPRIVFEEIIVNALVHRNYFVDAPVRILIFDDRVEVVSPGSLPNHLTVEKILAGNTNIRNPIIASYVARGLLPYWGLGSGVRRVQSAWRNIKFIDDKVGVQFRVVIYRGLESEIEPNLVVGEPNRHRDEPNPVVNEPKSEPNSESYEPNMMIIKSVGKDGYCLLEMIEQDPSLTILEMGARLNVSRETVKRILKKLKDSGMLVRENGTRGYWRVLKL